MTNTLRCDTFAREYANRLPEGLSDRILKASGVCAKLNETFASLAHTKIKLYILIDEYGNFTNTILAESGLNAYNELCHGDYYAAHCGFDAEKLHDTAIR